MKELTQYNLFLQDLTFNAAFRILDEAKDKSELLEVAKANGLVLPAQDIAVFKCTYAYTDRQNLNGCTLPKEEVEKTLATLNGKSVDLDHQRKTVVGYWLEGKIDGNKIIAYGAIWKDNFAEDYKLIKEMFDAGNLAVSFEAWGNRTYTNAAKTEYTLSDIEFAGGAILIKTKPAFAGAGVLEMAKERVLELASIMENNVPKEYVRERAEEVDYELFAGTQDELEEALETEEFALPLSPIEVDKVEVSKKLTTKERKAIPNEHFAVVKTTKDGKQVRKFPIADENHVRNALARLPQATKSLQKLGVSPATVKNKILKRARELKMTDLLKRHTKGNGAGGGDTYNNFDGDGGKMEKARMYVADMDHIMRNLQEVDCPNCNADSMLDPTMIDYGNNEMKVGCANCGSEFKVKMTPAVEMTKKGRKIQSMNELTQKSAMDSIASMVADLEVSGQLIEVSLEKALYNLDEVEKSKRFEMKDEDFAVVKTINVAKDTTKKVRMFPIHDLAHLNLAVQVLRTEEAQEVLKKLDVALDSVDKTLQRKVLGFAMKEQLKKYNVATPVEAIQACAKELIGRTLNEAELQKALEEAYSIFELHDGPQTKDAQGAPGQPGYSIIGMPKGKGDYNGYSVWGLSFTDNQFNRLVEKASGKDTEMEQVKELEKKLNEATAKLAAIEAEKAAAKTAADAALVVARKTELTEAYCTEAKLTDADLLDNTKFELAKALKEIATLKKGGTKTVITKSTFAKGSSDKGPDGVTTGDPTLEKASRDKINKLAFRSRTLTKGGYTELEKASQEDE